MIGFLEGTVAGRLPDGCLLDVGGVGYRLACSAHTLRSLPSEGGRCRLLTHLHVRDDVLALFGFTSGGELRMFEALIGIGGVGPRLALQMCSAFTPESLARVLRDGDAGALASVPGVGRKTAQRILLELRDRFGAADDLAGGEGGMAAARSALENLGYSPGEVRAALAEAGPDDGAAVEDIVRAALKALT